MQALKPNQERAKNVITLLWIWLVIEVASLISGYMQYNLLQTVAGGGELSGPAASYKDLREQTIAVLSLVAYIASAISFILWFRRAYFNLHLRVNNLQFEEGWAAGAWFVPVLNLFRPYQIMKELYLETRRYFQKMEHPVPFKLELNYLVLWWTFWILVNIVGQIVFRLSMHSDTVEELISTTQVSMLSNLLGIPLGLVTLKVIRDYADAEDELVNVREPESAQGSPV